MTAIDKMRKLENGVLNDEELTVKTLNGYGFSSEEISNLVDECILKEENGVYSVCFVDFLYLYGKTLIAEGNHDKADECFRKCFEMDPTHFNSCFQLFIRSVFNEDYDQALACFDILRQNEDYSADNNFYLCLLSMCTEIPKELKPSLKSLTLESMLIPEDPSRYANLPPEERAKKEEMDKNRNVLRRKVFSRRPIDARNYFDSKFRDAKKAIQDMAPMVMLGYAAKKESVARKMLADLISDRKYEEVEEFLAKKKDNQGLNTMDICILTALRDYISLQETRVVPKPLAEPPVQKTPYLRILKMIEAKRYDDASYSCYGTMDYKPLNRLLAGITSLIAQINLDNKNRASCQESKTDEGKESPNGSGPQVKKLVPGSKEKK